MRTGVPFSQQCFNFLTFIVDEFAADKTRISVKPMDAPLYVHDR